MEASSKPVILVVSVGGTTDWGNLEDFRGGLANIWDLADVKRARTVNGALRFLGREGVKPPDGILITDEAIAKAENRQLSERIAGYARAGGTVVIGYCFSTFASFTEIKKMWDEVWDLPWTPGSYHRTTLTLNETATTLRGTTSALEKKYSQKALAMKDVPREHSWYLPTEDSRTESMVFPSTPVTQEETPVAFAPVGQGWVGYTGDVNVEVATHLVMERMFGF